jgi:hypothetical protein
VPPQEPHHSQPAPHALQANTARFLGLLHRQIAKAVHLHHIQQAALQFVPPVPTARSALRWVPLQVQPANLVQQELLFRRFRLSACRAQLVLGVPCVAKRRAHCAVQGLTISTSLLRPSPLACSAQQEHFRQQAPLYARLASKAPLLHLEDRLLAPHALLVPIRLLDQAHAHRAPKGHSAASLQQAPP